MKNLPPEELKKIAIDLRAGRIFCDRQLDTCIDPGMVFMPIMFFDDKTTESLRADPPGLVYEYMSEALPRGVNGYPCFMSMRYLSIDDTKSLFEIIKKLEAAEKAVMTDTTPMVAEKAAVS